jgi:hypothetical protein
MRHRELERLSEAAVTEAIARTPIDHFIIWDGRACGAQTGSLRSRALQLVDEVWTPVALRVLIQRAARISDIGGLDPDTVRSAVRLHQSARPAAYLLVRKTISGDYVAVTDVPWPGASKRPLRSGDLVLDRYGRRLGTAEAEPAPALARSAR